MKLPVVPPTVSCSDVRPWQRGGAKLRAQRSLSLRTVTATARKPWDSQQHGGWEPGARGKANVSEPSLKRRYIGQAQAAESLGPKGTWAGPDAPNSSGADDDPPALRRSLNLA